MLKPSGPAPPGGRDAGDLLGTVERLADVGAQGGIGLEASVDELGARSRRPAPHKVRDVEGGKERARRAAASVRDGSDAVAEADWRTRAGRAGYFGKGILYCLVGILALLVAFGSRERTDDQQGAIAAVAGEPFGAVLLIVLALGLGAYAAYHLLAAVLGPRHESGAERQLERVASAARTVIYGGLCAFAVQTLIDARGDSSGGAKSWTAELLAQGWGQAAVVIGGLVIGGVALYQGHRALTRGFRDDLETERMSERQEHLADVSGVAGHAARAVVFALVGAFLIKAGVEHDASEAIGLDGALAELAQTSLGPLLLAVVAVGLIVYGGYCLIEARFRKV
jgi:hypothetical protein